MSDERKQASFRFTVLLAIVFGANVLSHADRHLMAVMLDAIREDLHLSDTEIGVLYGFSFSISFSIATLLFASLSDRISRIKMIAFSIGIWSLATIFFGAASNFYLLFGARLGVGAGQSILSPAVYSLLADNTKPKYLTRTNAIYATGAFIGITAILILGPYLLNVSIGEFFPLNLMSESFESWRASFILLGTIGVFYAVFIGVKFTDSHRTTPHKPPPYSAVFAFMIKNKHIYIWHFLGFSFYSMCLFTLIAWGPTYFARIHDVTGLTGGLTLAAGFAIATITGLNFSGLITDRMRSKYGEGVQFKVSAVAASCLAFVIIIFSMNISPILSTLSFLLALHFACYCIPPAASLMQMVTPQALRARAYAVFLCINNLIGMSLGALFVGVLNDYVFKSPNSVGSSIGLVVCLAAICSGIALMIGYRHSVIRRS